MLELVSLFWGQSYDSQSVLHDVSSGNKVQNTNSEWESMRVGTKNLHLNKVPEDSVYIVV